MLGLPSSLPLQPPREKMNTPGMNPFAMATSVKAASAAPAKSNDAASPYVFLRDMALGGTSGVTAKTICAPLERAKILLQVRPVLLRCSTPSSDRCLVPCATRCCACNCKPRARPSAETRGLQKAATRRAGCKTLPWRFEWEFQESRHKICRLASAGFLNCIPRSSLS